MRLDWGKGLGAIEASQPDGLTVTVANVNAGWRYAHWLVSHASRTGVERVRFADLEWSAPEGKWQPVTDSQGKGTDAVVARVFS
jgi:hypothetical protein